MTCGFSKKFLRLIVAIVGCRKLKYEEDGKNQEINIQHDRKKNRVIEQNLAITYLSFGLKTKTTLLYVLYILLCLGPPHIWTHYVMAASEV